MHDVSRCIKMNRLKGFSALITGAKVIDALRKEFGAHSVKQ